MRYDLLLKGGRIIDPSQDLDAVLDIAFTDGRVSMIAPDIAAGEAGQTHKVEGAIISPGLIDLHAHVYWGGTSLGVDAHEIAFRGGTTTFVDAGSAGAANLEGFKRHVMERTTPRILAFINVSFPGIFAFGKEVMVGECEDMRLLNARACVRAAREFSDVVVGVKARVGFNAGGSSGIAPLDIAIEVADELDLPVMAHIDFPPPGRKEILSRLRPGDILTHCFRPFPNAPIDRNENVRADILEARERGVLFDIGHGYGGFAFRSGRAAIRQGVLPDVISSDVHVLSKDGPAHDLLSVMNKFRALGMDLGSVIRAATVSPARAMRRLDLGTLAPGSVGDATVLRIEPGAFEHVDAVGDTIIAEDRLVSSGMVLGGLWWDGTTP